MHSRLFALPSAEREYINRLCDVLQLIAGTNIVGIYLLGSASQESYVAGESDLDVQMVVDQPLCDAQKQAIIEALSHSYLPCPATKLEFVVYHKAQLRTAQTLHYAINYNTGRTLKKDYVSFDHNNDPRHWFLLDIAMAGNWAITLFGESFNRIFPSIEPSLLLQAMHECLTWFNKHYPDSKDCYQCACRILSYLLRGVMVSKRQSLSEVGLTEQWKSLPAQEFVESVLQQLEAKIAHQ
ncbi:hypothetical protein [Vibrio mediterranei]|uniref:DUF4111 domain-containing protein n=1 Tax=Vibrio mediterranei TaxID=689 RepID=A0AAN1FHE0_9VIBR|nr:hypothetical protein [Vibrio mediterranei]ASI90651.1 hypothetical protein BSZ05_13135 [Vibrio mediterranei]